MLKNNHDQIINCIVVQVNNKGPGLEHSIHIKVNKWETTTKKGDHIHYFSGRCHCVCVCTDHSHHHAAFTFTILFTHLVLCQVPLKDKWFTAKYITVMSMFTDFFPHFDVDILSPPRQSSVAAYNKSFTIFIFSDCYCSLVSKLDFLTCFHVFEPLLELLWSEAVLVESVIPFDSLQHLQVATHQPVTSLHDHLHKGIIRECLLSCV